MEFHKPTKKIEMNCCTVQRGKECIDYLEPTHGMSMFFTWFGFRFNQDNVDKTQLDFSRLTQLTE